MTPETRHYAYLLREAAAKIREDFPASDCKSACCQDDAFHRAIADLLDDQAQVRELCDRAGAPPLDRTNSALDRIARAYLGRDS